MLLVCVLRMCVHVFDLVFLTIFVIEILSRVINLCCGVLINVFALTIYYTISMDTSALT